MGMRHRAGTYSYFSKDQYFTLPLPDVSIRTRRLLERFDVRAREWGRMHEFGTGPTVELAEREFRQARTALYKRIAELEDALSKES
jgi:hypothetical protein